MKPLNYIALMQMAVLLLVLPSSVLAHAFVDHSDPKVGSEVSPAPTEIKIWFTQDIEPDFSKIEVRDGKGNQVDLKDTHQDSKDKRLLIVSVPKLADGEYKVTWSVTSTDTHHTHGDFKFTVKTGS
jgi:methionine-rich copper-binding protein CopC